MIKIYVSGRIGQSEVKDLGTSQMIKFSVASQGWDSKLKEKKTDWIDCVLFGKRAENSITQQMLSKGTSIAIDGLLSINKYEKDGVKHTYYSVLVNDFDVLSSNGAKFNENDLPAEYEGKKVNNAIGLAEDLNSGSFDDSDSTPF